MNFLKNHFSMYARLPKEIYVLAFGKIMTSMGALIWPMLTLIMSEKIGLSGQAIGFYMMIFSMVMGPFYLLGGKLADQYNKKHIIVVFDLIGNSLYFICALMPVSMNTLYLLAAASLFQSMEQPAYDALIADLTTYQDRERAYSLNYLAMNLGLVLAPTIGGMLFNDYLNVSFFINGLADLSSTLLILFLIKGGSSAFREQEAVNEYEKEETGSIVRIFSERRLFFLFFLISGVGAVIYNQFNFLMPLHMEEAFSGSGAFRFGLLTSINAVVVVIGTPVLTKRFFHVMDIRIMYLGQLLESVGLACFIFVGHYFAIAVVGIMIFTLGEILGAISKTPYLTKRIPKTHRGRLLSIINSFSGLIGVLSNYGIGILVDHYSFSAVWMMIAAIGLLAMLLYSVYVRLDRKTYPGLYGN